MQQKRIFIWILAGSIACSLGVYYADPGTIDYFIEEDGLIENLTALFYMLTAVIAVSLVTRRRGSLPYLMVIAAIGLLGMLDELSFGERFFHLPMPKIGVWKVDGVHDLFYVAYKSMKNFSRAYGYIFYPVLVVAVSALLWLGVQFRSRIATSIGYYGHRDFFHLFYAACGLVLFALLVDIHLFKGEVAFLLEEIVELNSAFALIAACFALPKHSEAS
ncbi:MAG TPA: hypothetical protein DEQ23_04255 [Chlorobium sp.]|uniref:Uncharacterized protein n=1 Tax=Chlorobium phaeovibrioides (strain DSM 265 / 1930) TaxID=290318 RepID=A4SDZ4_CHLPM|nr:hypothetical protein [Chlorobium sp.]